MRRAAIISAVVLVLLLVYVSTFSYWWLRSPVKMTTTNSARQVRVVEFQFNKVSWHTQIIWVPAFWFMEHVCGYQEAGFAAMDDKSIMRYAK